MKSNTLKIVLSACLLTVVVAGCDTVRPRGQAYWQRVEDNSALYMTGPKAQQRLDQDISVCVREIDELVELEAVRGTLPPQTHSDYHRALKASGDLDFYDAPTRMGADKVSHSDFHDFEGCMRSKGWERVNYIRHETAAQAVQNYERTQNIRKFGVRSAEQQKVIDTVQVRTEGDFGALNK